MSYAPSVIKSIQKGTITQSGTSTTATITSVDTAKSVVLFGGSSNSSYSVNLNYVELTNATTVTAKRAATGDGAIVGYTVLEYY
jgi:hypothetical protein